jgi:hypothetical protein
MSNAKLKNSMAVLEQYLRWRMGEEDVAPVNPAVLSAAIDVALEALRDAVKCDDDGK